MGTNVRQNIVTNGLVMYLDAGNRMSYTSGSTTWRDLSGNNNNGTLTVSGSNAVSASFNSANQGSIQLSGTGSYIQNTSSSIFNFCNVTNDLPFSSNIWCYVDNLITKGFNICNKGDNGDGAQESYSIFVNQSTGLFSITLYDTIGSNQQAIKTTSAISTGSWINLSHTYSGTGGSTGISMYINGVLQPTTTTVQGTYTRMRVQNTNLYIGSFGSTGVYRNVQSAGRLGIFQLYNRALSAQEIAQNYNATKTRFGLT